MLHWTIVDIKKIHPSLSFSNFLLVESLLSLLSEILGLENYDADSGPSAWSRLLDVDVLLSDLAVAIKELDNLAHLDLEWEPSDQQGFVTVVSCDLISKVVTTARLRATASTSAASAATTAASSGATQVRINRSCTYLNLRYSP